LTATGLSEFLRFQTTTNSSPTGWPNASKALRGSWQREAVFWSSR